MLKSLARNSRLANHSAVAILVNKVPAGSLLMVQRATRKGDPWSGDMAFPGGRKERSDKDNIETARRELAEETGLTLSSPPLGCLNTLWTKSHNTLRPMAVHPFVFAASQAVSVKTSMVLNAGTKTADLHLSHEIAAAVWVPMSLFSASNRDHFLWKTRLGNIRVPCYHYQQFKIWGLSLRMIENFMKQNLLSEF